MLVVSDSSPIIVLSKLNRLEVLRVLFRSVFIPPAVHRELMAKVTDAAGPNAFESITVREPSVVVAFPGLHDGESAVIALAKELAADYLVIDEKAGRKVAEREGLTVIGTVGILESAAKEGLLDLAIAFDDLKKTDFRVASQLLDARLIAFNAWQSLRGS